MLNNNVIEENGMKTVIILGKSKVLMKRILVYYLFVLETVCRLYV